MITNNRLQRLIDTDRAGLVELMAAAYRLGVGRTVDSSLWNDGDFRSLLNETRREARDMGDLAGIGAQIARWNTEMRVAGKDDEQGAGAQTDGAGLPA